MPVTPVAAAPAVAQPLSTLPTMRRRRAAHPPVAAPVTTLPFTVGVGARVGVSGSLAAPIIGAVLGTLLLGLPGTIIGGAVGWMISH